MTLRSDVRDRLRARYREGLHAKIQALEVFLEERQRPGADAAPETEERLVRLAHNLRGSGGSFGYPEISSAAARVELSPPEARGLAIVELLEVLRRVVARGEQNTAARILIVEDDVDLASLISNALQSQDREITTAHSARDAQRCFNEGTYDFILLDILLPDGDGRNLLAQLQQDSWYGDPPVIFVLSVLRDAPMNAECLALGAERCFTKPLDPALIAAAMSARLERFHQRQANLHHDPLTGLLNRLGFAEAFARLSALSQRQGNLFSLAFIDLDDLKSINDTRGHRAGDDALRALAQSLRERLRRSDTAARWAGDEFVVAFPDTPADGAQRALEGALARLGALQRGVSFSAGVVEVSGGVPLDACLARADAMMYESKRRGGGEIVRQSFAGGGSPTVLYVEDDRAMGEAVRALFEANDLYLELVADVEEAMKRLRRGLPDLLMLDRRLGGEDGLEVLAAARQVGWPLPVLMLTAVGEIGEIEQAFALGADDYVQKPFHPRELLARARRLLWRSRSASGEASPTDL